MTLQDTMCYQEIIALIEIEVMALTLHLISINAVIKALLANFIRFFVEKTHLIKQDIDIINVK